MRAREAVRSRRPGGTGTDDGDVKALHELKATMPPPGGVPERPKGTGCKPVGSAYGGSNPPAPTLRFSQEVAHYLEIAIALLEHRRVRAVLEHDLAHVR